MIPKAIVPKTIYTPGSIHKPWDKYWYTSHGKIWFVKLAKQYTFQYWIQYYPEYEIWCARRHNPNHPVKGEMIFLPPKLLSKGFTALDIQFNDWQYAKQMIKLLST